MDIDNQFVGGGRFQILKVIGAGSFGQTYLARDLQQFNHLCTIKRLQPVTSTRASLQVARDLFEKEARVLYQLNHKHDCIPYLLAYFQEGDRFYLAQEFVPGQDLARELIPGQPIAVAEAFTLLKNILEPLAFLHSQNVIHRDIKPSNLMRRSDGKIVLIDFGAIKQLAVTEIQGDGTTKIGTIIGTPGYMPGEQTRGQAKFSSDVYAVGIVVIQALTGTPIEQLPEHRDTGELVWQNRVSFLPSPLRFVLEKMVRYHFKDRYINAIAALEAVNEIASEISFSNTNTIAIGVSSPAIDSFDFDLGYDGSSTITLQGNNTQNIIEISDNSGMFATDLIENDDRATASNLDSFNFDIISVDRTGREIKTTNAKASYYTEDLGNGIGLDMICISGGDFQFNSASKQKEQSPQSIQIKPFYMAKFLLTQVQWQAIVAKCDRVDKNLNEDPSHFKGDNSPVETVSWHDATEFCRRLSQKTGSLYRLPTEAEWEYACQAGGSSPFHFGDTISSDLANYNANYTYAEENAGKYRARTVEVGTFPPNGFGLYDMHGQVWEWCADSWREDYHQNANSNNDRSPLRGGAWNYRPNYCRSNFRYHIGQRNLISKFIGFRIVCEMINS